MPYYEIFYKLPHIKSGAHHPDSVLWFKTGTTRNPSVQGLDPGHPADDTRLLRHPGPVGRPVRPRGPEPDAAAGPVALSSARASRRRWPGSESHGHRGSSPRPARRATPGDRRPGSRGGQPRRRAWNGWVSSRPSAAWRTAGSWPIELPDSVPVWACGEGRRPQRVPRRAARHIRDLAPDVIHARNGGAWIDAAAAWLLAGRRGRLAFSFHGWARLDRMPRRQAFLYPAAGPDDPRRWRPSRPRPPASSPTRPASRRAASPCSAAASTPIGSGRRIGPGPPVGSCSDASADWTRSRPTTS